MKCEAIDCLICKHAKVGDNCKDNKLTFELADFRDLDDRLIIYKCRKDYLEKAKGNNVIKKYKQQIKETEKNIKRLEEITCKVKLLKEINHKEIDRKGTISVKIK